MSVDREKLNGNETAATHGAESAPDEGAQETVKPLRLHDHRA